MPTTAVPEHARWAVATLDPGPDELLLEIGCGPGVAVALLCERLVGGRVVAVDRSATAIGRATKRNAEHVAAGRAVLRTRGAGAVEALGRARTPGRFDKVLAMNVNLFWVRSPAKELDLVKPSWRLAARCICSTATGDHPRRGRLARTRPGFGTSSPGT